MNMNEQLIDSKLALLDITNQIEKEFLMWRQHNDETLMTRVEDLLDKAIMRAQDINEILPDNPEGWNNESVFEVLAEAAADGRLMDARFMTVGFGWVGQSKVSPTAFNTINRAIIHLAEKGAELKDNFTFLRQAIQREAANIS